MIKSVRIAEAAVVLSVFGDESSDETKRRVFAVAGVIGTEPMWEALEAAWVDRTGGIPFHANHCESDWGDYKNTPHAENQLLYRDLTTLLAKSDLSGWGFAIDLIAQKKVFPDAPEIAYYKGFSEVVSSMLVFAASCNQPVKFTFDRRAESEYNSAYLYKIYRERPENRVDMFRNITFACSREEPRVQVADLWARETMKAVDNLIGPKKRPPRKSWEALVGTNRFKADAISEEWFYSLKIQMTEIQKKFGMEPTTYGRWLNENGLSNNVTNVFRFLGRSYNGEGPEII